MLDSSPGSLQAIVAKNARQDPNVGKETLGRPGNTIADAGRKATVEDGMNSRIHRAFVLFFRSWARPSDVCGYQ